MIISHVRPPYDDSEEWSLQSNEDHSRGVSHLAAIFANEFGLSDIARIAGLLHDKGKEQQAFQSYIKQVSGYDTTLPQQPKAPHAYVGALIAKKLYPQFYPLLSPIIIGHHRGLYDFSEFVAKMQESKMPCDVVIDGMTEISTPQITGTPNDIHHIIRQLFSCLVDADWLDTELFMNAGNAQLRGNYLTMAELSVKLNNYLDTLKCNAPLTPLNKIRDNIQQLCYKSADSPTGFYSLSVPTGGGKTLSSLLWAVHHCIKHNKRRIIIAIPYTSIITQTAQILREVFGSENVLEHHSATDPLKSKDKNEAIRQKLATENWDYPIIVTTNVQLFESI
ncbi:MAG: CRISPR-associated endonuclease Cas3'' [Rikenellaceae bacterium]